MEHKPDRAAEPSALDKVAAALAELGQETAAAIAEHASVGYSTATKRLRVLEEAGQAQPFRADDGRTLWRHVANAADSTGSDDPPQIPAPSDDDADDAARPDEATASAEETGTAVAAGPDNDSTGTRPDDARRRAPESDADRPTPQDPPPQADSVLSEPTATEVEGEGDEATRADAENSAAVGTSDEADSRRNPEPAGATDSTAPSAPAEAPSASTGGKPRRSKGSLRGAILGVLEAHPDQPFKTSQLCKAIDKANEGSGSTKASAGAVVNAAHKLVANNLAVQVVEKPAAFQLAPKSD